MSNSENFRNSDERPKEKEGRREGERERERDRERESDPSQPASRMRRGVSEETMEKRLLKPQEVFQKRQWKNVF